MQPLRVLLCLAALVAGVLTAACGAPLPPTPAASAETTPTVRPAPTSAPTVARSLKPDTVTLTWWTPEFLSPQAPQPAGQILAGELAAFTDAQDGKVRVEAVRKARYGKGGLLDALRTAQPVARDTLPDLVALDVAEVGKAVEAGLLQPLNPLLDAAVIENLYPFASEAGLFGEKLYAVQYLADIDHVAYLPAQVAEPPSTWSDLITRRTAYLFPLRGPQTGSSDAAAARPAENLSHAVLGQYLSAGGALAADRSLVLESQPLLRLLTFYADASKAGVLPPVAQDLSDGEAVWSVFAQGQAPLAYVSARRYIGRGDLQAGYAPSLGDKGAAVSVASGWVLAIVATDPERQVAAAGLIAWLLRPDNAGNWASRAGWLPTSPDALEALGADPYWSFLDQQLAQARGLPASPDYAATAGRIQGAIVAVLQGQSTPSAATEAAVKGAQ